MSCKNLNVMIVILIGTTMALATLNGCRGKTTTLARVGSEKITDADLDLVARVNPRLKPRLATPIGKQKVLENYVEQELLYIESRRRGLDRSDALKDKISLYNKILIAQALLDDELDKKVHEYYDNHKDEFERVKISDIFIRTTPSEEPQPMIPAAKKNKVAKKPASRPEAEALKLALQAKNRVGKGEDFGKVVKELSEDDRAKMNQGDLGYITIHDKRLERMNWLPLGEKAFAMKEGEVSDPIKTKDGFHIIKVTEGQKMQSFDDAEAGIKFRLQADIRNQLMEDLKKKYTVEYAKGEGPSSPPANPVASPAAPEASPSAPAAPAPVPPPPGPQAGPQGR